MGDGTPVVRLFGEIGEVREVARRERITREISGAQRLHGDGKRSKT